MDWGIKISKRIKVITEWDQKYYAIYIIIISLRERCCLKWIRQSNFVLDKQTSVVINIFYIKKMSDDDQFSLHSFDPD